MTELYSVKRKEMKTGDLLAWKSTKINSVFDFILFLYQKIFKAEYIHVGIVYTDGDRFFVVEATPPVVRLFPISMSIDDFYYIPCNIENNDKHKDVLLSNLGKPYGLIDLIKGLIGIRTSENQYYCSELAYHFYKSVGILNRDSDGITPDSLVEGVLKVTKATPVYISIDRGNINAI